jgi:hypothetical protein
MLFDIFLKCHYMLFASIIGDGRDFHAIMALYNTVRCHEFVLDLGTEVCMGYVLWGMYGCLRCMLCDYADNLEFSSQ